MADDARLSPMTRRLWAGLAVVLILGAGLRVFGLGALSFWYDEANTVLLSEVVTDPGKAFSTDYTSEPPLLLLARGFTARFATCSSVLFPA